MPKTHLSGWPVCIDKEIKALQVQYRLKNAHLNMLMLTHIQLHTRHHQPWNKSSTQLFS